MCSVSNQHISGRTAVRWSAIQLRVCKGSGEYTNLDRSLKGPKSAFPTYNAKLQIIILVDYI